MNYVRRSLDHINVADRSFRLGHGIAEQRQTLVLRETLGNHSERMSRPGVQSAPALTWRMLSIIYPPFLDLRQ
jgi:hypothetical protein